MKYHRRLLLILFSLYFVFNLGWDAWLYTLPHVPKQAWGSTTWNYLFNVWYGGIYLIGAIITIGYGFVTSVKYNLWRMLLLFVIGILILFIPLFIPTLKNHLYEEILTVSISSLSLLISTLFFVYAVISSLKSNLGRMLVFFGLEMLCLAVGQGIWSYYALFQNNSVPYPSSADVAYVLSYPFLYLGVFYLVKVYWSLIDKKLLRDAAIFLILSIIIVFVFISKPDLTPGQGLLANILNVFYPVGDTLSIVGALIAVRIGGGKIHFSLYLLSLGLFLQGAADLVYTARNNANVYWNGDISDLLFTISAYIISIGLFEIIYNFKHNTQQVPNVVSIPGIKPDEVSVPVNPKPDKPQPPTGEDPNQKESGLPSGVPINAETTGTANSPSSTTGTKEFNPATITEQVDKVPSDQPVSPMSQTTSESEIENPEQKIKDVV